MIKINNIKTKYTLISLLLLSFTFSFIHSSIYFVLENERRVKWCRWKEKEMKGDVSQRWNSNRESERERRDEVLVVGNEKIWMKMNELPSLLSLSLCFSFPFPHFLSDSKIHTLKLLETHTKSFEKWNEKCKYTLKKYTQAKYHHFQNVFFCSFCLSSITEGKGLKYRVKQRERERDWKEWESEVWKKGKWKNEEEAEMIFRTKNWK